jgi:hypothetical protein
VRENLAHSAGRGDEGEEAHRGVTEGTAQGKNFIAKGPGKTTAEDAAFEIAAKSLFDIGRRCRLVRLGREGQPSLEVRLDGALPQRVFGTAALITAGAGGRRLDCGRQGTTRVLG